jgi:hypothetical protein
MIFYTKLSDYIVNFLLFGDSDKGATIAAIIPYPILTFLKQNFRMKTGDELIRDGYLIAGMPTHHATFVLQRVVIGLQNFTLLDDKLVFFCAPGIGMSGFPFDFMLT